MSLDGGYIGSLDHAIANLHIGRQQGRQQGFEEGLEEGYQQGLWDYAAGSLILSEAGGFGQTLSGEAVFNNTLDKRSAVCACDAGLFTQWTHWLGAHIATAD